MGSHATTHMYSRLPSHSAQHLISAIANEEFGMKTTSWTLGAETCTIGTVRLLLSQTLM